MSSQDSAFDACGHASLGQLPLDILPILLRWCRDLDEAEKPKWRTPNDHRNSLSHPSHSINLRNRIRSLVSVNWLFHRFCQLHVGEFLEISHSPKQLKFIRDEWLPKHIDQVRRISITGSASSFLPSLGLSTPGLDLLYEICSRLLEGQIESLDVDHHLLDVISFEVRRSDNQRWPTLFRTMAPKLTQLTVNNHPMDEWLPDDVDELELVQHFRTLTKLQGFRAHNVRPLANVFPVSPLAHLLATQAELRSLTLSQCSCVDQSWCQPEWMGSLVSLKIRACVGVGMDWIRHFSHKFSQTLTFLEVTMNDENSVEAHSISLPKLTHLSLVGCSGSLKAFTSCSNLKRLVLGRGRREIEFEALNPLLESWDHLKEVVILDHSDRALPSLRGRCQTMGIELQFTSSSTTSYWQLRHPQHLFFSTL
ncbi:hypothetical protein CROQUDRAFT_44940 [Cronartium quercuum f. sp. fusiforme G11]|uniref:F-box domain-containing protein n=1 Tax=Cronartium quercuum f. sp. fusiforme G11 TaxID=708437 RepID=A0A9P6NHF7_9BASI|nr:hypothetical protein CROQUDRAFT_44940 [Cronartium quercuum f. sp. fusiforme G11]